jgi:ABC-type transport system involved in cytochrome c biogenesis permease subunit
MPTPNTRRSQFPRKLLAPFASLKFTVALLATSMLLILVGSLAQARRDVWLVVHEYFRTWIAWIEVKDFFPPSMFPSLIDKDWTNLPFDKFPYPGGWLIGSLLCVNLLAAHLYRVKITVKGKRLAAGIVAMTAAISVTAAIIFGGDSNGQLQGEPLISFDALWNIFLVAVGGVSLASLAMTSGKFGSSRGGRVMWMVAAVLFGGICVYYVIGGSDARLANESMRILWQLVLGSIAGSAILAASFLLFRSRAGIIALHLGIVLLMVSELQVGMFGEEHQLILLEGQTTDFMRDIREQELAIIDTEIDDQSKQQVWVVPGHLLRRAANNGSLVDDERLPFKFGVPRYLTNSVIRPAQPEDDNPADAGLGAAAFAEEKTPVDGIGNGRDVASIYVTVVPDGDEAATYLVSQEMGEFRGRFAERITVGDRSYDLYLRTKRTYLPWSVKLNDVSRTNYIGTSTPKDYRSEFAIVESDGQAREFTTWMNNPVRFSGQTFYQQGYEVTPSGTEMTTLQVVRNTGWMLPYVGCMVVAFGMFAQFGQGLARFLTRTTKRSVAEGSKPSGFTAPDGSRRSAGTSGSLRAYAIPVLITLAMAGWLGRKASPPKPLDNGIQLSKFEQTPVAFGGRTLPFGTFARNSLQSILGKTEFEAELEPDELAARRDQIKQLAKRIWSSKDWNSLDSISGDYAEWLDAIAARAGVDSYAAEQLLRPTMTAKRPASWWMLDTLSRPEVASRHRVFRIVDDELLAMLQLEKRPGFAYSLAEINAGMPGIEAVAKETRQLLRDNEAARLTPLQRRVQTLVSELNRVRGYPFVFNTVPLPDEGPLATLVETWGLLKHLESQPGALTIPTGAADVDHAWQSRVAADAIVHARDAIKTLKTDDLGQLKRDLRAELPDDSSEIVKAVMEMMNRLGDRRAVSIRNQAHTGSMTGINVQEMLETQAIEAVVDDLHVQAGDMLFSDDDAATDKAIATMRRANLAWGDALDGWRERDASQFKSAVAGYHDFLASEKLPLLNLGTIRYESFLNHFAPQYYTIFLYLTALVLTFLSWVVLREQLWRSAMGVMLLAFVVHSFYLIARMQISGRPPVTNLYSSAVFIGWALVLGTIVFEYFSRLGMVSVIGCIAGASTLTIAHFLGIEQGDTLSVMQAVLDTQFWLATHVVCVTIGYAATFMAGMLGIAYLIAVRFTKLEPTRLKMMGGVIYGTIGFALLFSFVGTVLGGLWADDSWGRFWGWDPKENGALLIVIWNAIVLHARWDKMIRDNGTAILAIGGNIVTAWSWFGVNELGAGLHSYGFTEGRLLYLAWFVALNLLLMTAALVPTGRKSHGVAG